MSLKVLYTTALRCALRALALLMREEGEEKLARCLEEKSLQPPLFWVKK